MKPLVMLVLVLAAVGGVAGSLVYVSQRPDPGQIAMRDFEKSLPAVGAAVERTRVDRLRVESAQLAVDNATRDLFDYHVRYYLRNGIDRTAAEVFAEADLEHEDGVAPALAQRIANGG